MRPLLVSLFLAASFSASANEVLLTCTHTTFSDLNKIVISTGSNASEVVITEIADNGSVNTVVRDAKDFTGEKIELSSWYGYTRNLLKEGDSWYIEHFDECSGGASSVICE